VSPGPCLYEISINNDFYSDFYYWFDFYSPHLRPRITGNYEPEVLEKLAKNVDESSEFWEVGAGWGYFSLALADNIQQAFAFEPLDSRYGLMENSIVENDFENIKLYKETVESLDNYKKDIGIPDVVLMDIDAWEYNVLSNSEEMLKQNIVWIIEIHKEPMGVSPPPSNKVKPKEVENLFIRHNYQVERIAERKRDDDVYTYHIMAK
jgi:predicted O-methyltransferase YrrM